jgi:putative DNA primase/helicase
MHNVISFADRKAIETAPAFSEESLALQFASIHENSLRYVPKWGWLQYDNGKWQIDEQLIAFDLSRDLCGDAANVCNKKKQASVLASKKTVAAVESLARSDRRLIANTEQWDSDPFLLLTPNGIVDLRSGNVRPARQRDYMTKMTAVARGANCPTWHEFLKRTTDGDNDLQSYLQRVIGYALTGDTSEHALFFAYGVGANGKSTFLNAVSGMIGDYHKTAPIETFTESKNDRHPTELAGLRGARMVTASKPKKVAAGQKARSRR